ncbi:MAG TPA: gluconate 2-dehydrogenase subunit 3 family protein [Gemmatimonadaceae bacterium]|nr:gluconate 2-dehydrogenase subunit 3 family protein [Gemmatimonadaceae bacterium]
MNRREALKATTALLGGALALAACGREPRQAAAGPPRVLTPDDQALVEEIADTLLPTTAASPGAKAAGAGAEINLLLSDCYPAKDQQRVVQGLREFRGTCGARCAGAGFASLPRPDRERLLREIDAEAKRAGETHYFGLLRELALRAYFSSEVGMTQALRYVRVPGKWVGCVPRTPGQPAWG